MPNPISHHFVIQPFKSVGPIRFGMHKDEVADAFRYVYRSFFKGPNSKVRADQCVPIGLIIHYDELRQVNYIEITKPEHVAVTLELFGTDVTGISVRRFADLLKAHANDVTRTHYGYESAQLGVNSFNSNVESDDDPVQCIGVARKVA